MVRIEADVLVQDFWQHEVTKSSGNMLGRYAFILPDLVARSELRRLRDPRNTDDES